MSNVYLTRANAGHFRVHGGPHDGTLIARQPVRPAPEQAPTVVIPRALAALIALPAIAAVVLSVALVVLAGQPVP